MCSLKDVLTDSVIVSLLAQSLDTRTATYILAGIAGLYTLITFFCLLVTICLWYKLLEYYLIKTKLK